MHLYLLASRQDLAKEGNEQLKTVVEGVQMTETLLLKAFKQHGLQRFGERGDKFDPNLHDALFQLVDQDLEVGTIGQVCRALPCRPLEPHFLIPLGTGCRFLRLGLSFTRG